MPVPKRDMIGTRYNWDTGDWEVYVSAFGMDYCRGYELELDAEEGKARLLHQLAVAPDGDTQAVLELWKKGEL